MCQECGSGCSAGVAFAKKPHRGALAESSLKQRTRLRGAVEDALEAHGFDDMSTRVTVEAAPCAEPGYPSVQTVFSVAAAGERALEFRVLKPLADVAESEALDAFKAAVSGDGPSASRRRARRRAARARAPARARDRRVRACAAPRSSAAATRVALSRRRRARRR